MYTCITSFLRKLKLLPSTPGCSFYLEGIRNSKGKGVQEEAIISKGVGLDADKVFFSGEFETRSIVFIDDLTLTVIHVNVIGS